MNLTDIHRVYFLGIGGIGMSTLARWFNSRGMAVSGYDKTETPLTIKLIEEGIAIHFDDDPKLINKEILEDQVKSLIIYTPAIPPDHREFNHLKKLNFNIYKRSEVLGMITSNHYTIAVAGTHGKTSTTSIIAHILNSSGKNCAAFVGGIMTNYNSNLILPENDDENVIVVVEADEFDRSFLRLNPDLAVVTAADPDHLDIYGDGDQLKQSFRDFIGKISDNGKFFIQERVATELEVERLSTLPYSQYDITKSEIHTENLRVDNEAFVFDYISPTRIIENIFLHFPGRHNVENAIAAISVALEIGIDNEKIKSAISSYQGVKRRFEYILKTETVTYIDDYAHHPEEIRSFLSALRELYPSKKITAIFQPHLYTRTRDFADGFSESLLLADEVVLIPVYPARELPIEGVDSQMILDIMGGEKGRLMLKEDILDFVKESELEIVATIGAGDIDQLVLPIKRTLEVKYDAVNS